LEGLFQSLPRKPRRTGVARYVYRQSHPVVRNNVVGRCGDHDHVTVGNNGARTVLREWTLVQAIFELRPSAPVVLLPVVFRDIAKRRAGAKAHPSGAGELQKSASVQRKLPSLVAAVCFMRIMKITPGVQQSGLTLDCCLVCMGFPIFVIRYWLSGKGNQGEAFKLKAGKSA